MIWVALAFSVFAVVFSFIVWRDAERNYQRQRQAIFERLDKELAEIARREQLESECG